MPRRAGMTSVAVAVAVTGGSGSRSRRAVQWTAENLAPKADRFILVHVMPSIISVPTPSGGRIPVTELEERVVELYVEELKAMLKDKILVSFKRLCRGQKVETFVLEDDNPATALVRYACESGISSLVLGSRFSNCIVRRLRGPGVPKTVLKSAPDTCDVHVVYRRKVITKSASCPSTVEISSRRWMSGQSDNNKGYGSVNRQISECYSPLVDANVQGGLEALSMSDNLSVLDSREYEYKGSTHHNRGTSASSTLSNQSHVQAEVEQLRLELQNAVAMYKKACAELVHTQSKVHLLSSEFLEETKKVNAALEREETMKKIATEEKERYLQALNKVEKAKGLLAKESCERQIVELNVLKEYLEKQKLVDELFLNDKRYKRYTINEIEVATNFFSKSNVIGEGGYGKVYKCNLDHTPVAIKVLRSDATNKKEEFLREVEVLSRLRHPHLVLLIGACPESGCLVYEYLENGSLEECIVRQNGKPPLPWFVRFRIVFEVACGLAFLHNSKPEPIIHRDLKPGNILLDRNYVGKIGDVGLAKLFSDFIPDNITEYRDSILAGTFHYMDPEYQRTGTVRPKSDLYAFGIIILQMLTGRKPSGLLLTVEKAMANGSLADILDTKVTDWPLVETEELAQIALHCSKLRCRDRPDLDTEVLPALKKLVDVAAACMNVERSNLYAPKHYFCPILQEIMEDPYIAADGFTYELRAIKAWLEKHSLSPVTKLKLQHSTLTPNHTLRSAIQEWKSRVNFQPS